ncbi:hypothetical protein Tco_0811519 [Tanacetum coccineum]
MTNEESVKDMTSKFDKLAKFEGQDFRRWQKKMHFLLTTLKVVYVLSTPTLWESLESKYMAEDASAKKFLDSGQYTQHNLIMDEAISVAVIIDKLPPSWKEFKHGLKHKKEELNLVQLGSHLRIEEVIKKFRWQNFCG